MNCFRSCRLLAATSIAVAIQIAGAMIGCSGGNTTRSANQVSTIGNNPIPTIGFLDPGCAPVGAQTFTLYVQVTNAAPNSVVRWNGKDLPTAVSGGLFAKIPAEDIATAGTAAVTVFNPAPGGGESSPATFNIVAGGVGPNSLAVDPTGKFAYVADQGCPDDFTSTVSMFTISPTDGTLTSAGPSVTTEDFGAESVAVDPTGKFVYVANSGAGDTAGSVSIYKINPTDGTLTSTGTVDAPCTPSPGSCSPSSLAIHPSGNFVYAANEGGFTPTSVSTYAINAGTGALALIGTVAVDGRAAAVAVDPSGRFAYVADGYQYSDGSKGVNVSMYSIDAGTGLLTSLGKVTAGTSPSSIAIHPSGKFVYVANYDSNDISMYAVDTTGNLISIGTLPAPAGPIVIHPSGQFAYVTSSSGISMYTIDTTTGALTLGGITGAGSSPGSITIHPSGQFAYGTNYVTNGISMYSIDEVTGSLTLIGTVGT